MTSSKEGDGNDIIIGLTGSETLMGGKGDDVFQVDLASGGGSQIIDRDGDGTLLITKNASVDVLVGIEEDEIDELNPSSLADINLSAPEQGTIGLGQVDSHLVIDVNQDGRLEIANDLTIHQFFNSSGTDEGKGFLEKINNLEGEDILEFFTEGDDD